MGAGPADAAGKTCLRLAELILPMALLGTLPFLPSPRWSLHLLVRHPKYFPCALPILSSRLLAWLNAVAFQP